MGFITNLLNTKKGEKIKETFEKVKDVVEETTEVVGNKVENYMNEKISYDTFLKTEIKIGKILEAEKIEKSDKLLKLSVDFGEEKPRQIISGISKSYQPSELIGKKTVFVTNLEPRKIFGLESNGMILGVSNSENGFSLLIPEKDNIKIGTRAS